MRSSRLPEALLELFGPYPFPKFAVVENFFPTGYGFPSYTPLGSTILRLPFILSTSLGHEIAHCWWGNGVLVDYESGNWSEALTTYVSDYLYAGTARRPGRAKDYRLQALRNYTTLVPPAKDFPLARFTGRIDPATKAVGYDKGMMVFHMLRRRPWDEDAFWGALRDVYRERLFLADRLGRPAPRVREDAPAPARSLLRPVGQPQGRPAHPPRGCPAAHTGDG